MNNIYIHADDYGYTLNTSKDILDCMKKGALDSVSIICNTSFFDESMELLYETIPSIPFLPLISVHLNFVEGFNLSDTKLLSRNGINVASWLDILVASIGGMKKDLKTQLKKEIKAQINKTQEVVEKCIEIAEKNNISYKQKGIRIDSHTHTHSIPLVFEALEEVIREEGYHVEFIRNPKEPLSPFITNVGLGFKPVNYVKNNILNFFSHKIDKYSKKNNLPVVNMWGLVMSGNMDIDRINKLLPKMIKSSKNRTLEILFHPGLALKDEIREELNIENMNNFNMSSNRHIEKDAVLRIKSIMK